MANFEFIIEFFLLANSLRVQAEEKAAETTKRFDEAFLQANNAAKEIEDLKEELSTADEEKV